MNILDHIRIIPDFPTAGINFYDIASLLANPDAFNAALGQMEALIAPHAPDMLMGIEARGFLLAAPLAARMGLKMGMVRKEGKLPGLVLSHSYELEYGEDTIEIQPDLVEDHTKVVLIDDLLATGGTLQAAEHLFEKTNAQVIAHICLLELDGLGGRNNLTAPFFAVHKCPA